LREARARTCERLSSIANAYLAMSDAVRRDELQESITLMADMLSGRQPYAAAARAAFKEFAPQFNKLTNRLGTDPDAEILRAELTRVQRSASPATAEKLTAGAFEAVAAISQVRRQFKGRAELPPHANETIRRISLRNFKAIEVLDFELSEPVSGDADRTPALMLLGENATGKSTVLEAVALALLGTSQIAKLGVRAKAFVPRSRRQERMRRGRKPAETAVILEFDGGGPPVQLRIDGRAGRFEGDAEPSTVLLGYGPRRFFAEGPSKRHVRDQAEHIRTLFDPLAVIANPKHWLMNCEQSSFDAAIRALRQLLLLPDEAMVKRPDRGQRRGAEIMFDLQGESQPLGQLSEGYKTIIATGVDIMREMLTYWPDLESARGVVLIDEIETHLHPRWKMRIVDRLRRAMPRVQFIATTHDPLCLRGLDDGEAEVLRRDAEQRIERVTELPSVAGLSVEQLLTSEYFGLFSTEDPSFEEKVTHYVALAAKAERSPSEESDLEHYRQLVDEKLKLGSTPQSQLVQAAVSEYLVQQRRVAESQRPALKRAAVSKVIDLWRSIDDEGEEP